MKIAIAGYGLEGESNYRYFSKDSGNTIVIADERGPTRELPIGVETIIGEGAFLKLDGFDIVMRTASLSPRKIKTDGKIWSSTNEFFRKCPCQIIGVTGTKGKGTISSLIASILRSDGRKVWLVGNIGVPPLQYLSDIQPTDIVVFELSSFQLWDLECSPHVAVITMIEPEHLDIHLSYDDYIEAKANIRRYQNDSDICIYHPRNKVSEHISNISKHGRTIRYAAEDGGGVFVKDGSFWSDDEIICDLDKLQLLGEHNIENACAAITVARYYDIASDVIANGLKDFKGLEHRLEFVRELDGVKYYNDSFSSSTPATIAAIKAFTAPEIVIMGGIDRGGDFTQIAGLVARLDNIKKIIVIGEIRDKLAGILREISPNTDIETTDIKDIKDIVMLAKGYSSPGDVILISPGCASFDMFKDFYDRGNKFKEAVNGL
jgi:UDP-N-acetylmuramoylalanine--D-glutamate ligase